MARPDPSNPFDTLSDDPRLQPRLRPRSVDTLDEAHRRIHTGIVESVRKVGEMSNGALPGPFNAWMYVSLPLTRALDAVGVAIRTETGALPTVLKEIAICVVAAHRRCNVAFWAHERIATKAGLTSVPLEAIKQGRTPSFSDLPGAPAPAQTAVWRFVTTYLETHRVDDAQYDALRAVLGSDEAMVQLVLVIGHYCNIAAQLNLLRVPAPGAEQPFPPEMEAADVFDHR